MLVDVFSKALRQGGRGRLGRARHHREQERHSLRQEPALVASGIRVGTPAVTTRGMREAEMERVGEFIARVLAAPTTNASCRP